MLCDAETRKCPEGESVYRNPLGGCEFFPCPSEEKDETAVTSSAFLTGMGGPMAPSPAFPDLPKPTLPTITKPSPYVLPAVLSKPDGGTIDLGNSSSESSADTSVVVVGKDKDVVDDGDDESEEVEEVANKPKSPENELAFGTFSVEDWLASSAVVSRDESLLMVVSFITIMAIFTI